ncbi:hypothetical protein B296_00029635 [Ensete ventricosum]|uniref:Uncharacterized protein n=1 Tax=Ensete ventricosum TaxID=4639 RepID=A0A426ZCP6_ENSVE|nr:hypothetical protein B296_00029635 [Ensete ventricosum]
MQTLGSLREAFKGDEGRERWQACSYRREEEEVVVTARGCGPVVGLAAQACDLHSRAAARWWQRLLDRAMGTGPAKANRLIQIGRPRDLQPLPRHLPRVVAVAR